MTATEADPRGVIRKLNLIGLFLVAVLIGGVGGWATTSQLAGAVIAPGTIVVESNVKKVQHPTGGVVGEILVKEGSEVKDGDVVLRLDDTVTRSTLGVVRSQLDETLAREARLLTERDDADAIVFPARLTSRRDDPSVAMALAGEEKLFESRRTARAGQRSQLRERITQLNEEVRGLSAQLAAKENELELIKTELVGVTDLYKKNLVSISRYMQLQRDQTRLQGERGQFIADIARARGKISETELQIIQVDQDFRTEVLGDLREAQGKIAELKERVTAAEDQLKRVDLRAPQAGIVHQLAVHTLGGVIGNGETVMQIVPRADELVVEAKVAPSDIDQVAIGAEAVVRMQWLRPGAHVNSVGFHAQGSELDEVLVKTAFLAVEARASAFAPPPQRQREFGLRPMASVQEPLIVHRDLADLGPQALDLLVPLVGGPTLQRRLAARQKVLSPLGQRRRRHPELAGDPIERLAPQQPEDRLRLPSRREAPRLAHPVRLRGGRRATPQSLSDFPSVSPWSPPSGASWCSPVRCPRKSWGGRSPVSRVGAWSARIDVTGNEVTR